MEQLTINEIVKVLQKEGYKITYRTFWYYIDLGILPKPTSKRGKKGVYGYYSKGFLEPMRLVLDWRDNGLSLNLISDKLYSYTRSETEKIFKKNGFNDFRMSEFITILDHEILIKISSSYKASSPEVFKAMTSLNKEFVFTEYDEVFDNFINKLKWLSKNEIKHEIFSFIIRKLNDWLIGYMSAGLDYLQFKSRNETASDKQKAKDIVESNKIFFTKINKVLEKIQELENKAKDL